MLRVGMDISQIAHGGGVATYTDKLAHHLLDVKDLKMTFFYSLLRKPYMGDLPNVKKFFIPPSALEFLFNRWRFLTIEKFIGEVDVFHSTDWMQPPAKAKKVTTYHDVIPIKFPRWSHPKIVEVHKRRLKLVEKEVDMIIAVSQTTKDDLLEVSQIPREKVVVIYEGVDETFKPHSKEKVEEFRKKYNLPTKFVLAIGGIGDRRNLARVKEACKNYHLIITGETIPGLSNEEMPLLYSAASVLLYPSLYEGFGLPILEAMACGTPVITSNIGAMAEIAGRNNAFLVDPLDVEDISLSLKTLMEDEQIREDLIGNGILHASNFRWDNVAAETAEVYKKVANE